MMSSQYANRGPRISGRTWALAKHMIPLPVGLFKKGVDRSTDCLLVYIDAVPRMKQIIPAENLNTFSHFL